MRRYDPKADTRLTTGAQIGGQRSYEFLIIPEVAGTLQVPPHSFSFFDPATEKYQTVRTQPIEITVTADANAPAPAPDDDRAAFERSALRLAR